MTDVLKARQAGRSGPVVAVVHGWGWDGRILDGLVKALALRCRVVQPDLPGYGLNRDVAVRDFDHCVELLACSVPDADMVVGWSLGGLLAIAWAARQPLRCIGLIGATPRFMWAPDWPHGMSGERFDAFAADVQHDARRTRTRFAALASLGDFDARASRAALARWVDVEPPAVEALGLGLQWLQRRDERRALAGLETPTVWLHGERDRVVDAGSSRMAADACGGSLGLVPGAAHLPWLHGVPPAFLDRLLADNE